MSNVSELGQALRGWRDRVTPAEAGLPAGGPRRAAGLRREELALLAGVSADYITRLEQGRAASPSAQVLAALARALRLSGAERQYLFTLAGQPPPAAGHITASLTPGVQRLLDQLDAAVSVYDAAWNLIAWNPLWAALMGDPSARRGPGRNVLWRYFTGQPGRVTHAPDQEAAFEAAAVADLRSATGRYPDDAKPAAAGRRSARGQQPVRGPVGRPRRRRPPGGPQDRPAPGGRAGHPGLRCPHRPGQRSADRRLHGGARKCRRRPAQAAGRHRHAGHVRPLRLTVTGPARPGRRAAM